MITNCSSVQPSLAVTTPEQIIPSVLIDAPADEGPSPATVDPKWLSIPGVHKNRLSIAPMHIEAPASAVWELVKDIGRYDEFTNGKVQAQMVNNAPLATGNDIDLRLNTELGPLRTLIFGKQLAHSVETVVIDPERKALGWHRKMPLSCGKQSARWQIVVPRGPTCCDYYSGLYLPGPAGVVAMLGVGKELLSVFQSIGSGIKNAAETSQCL